MREQTAEEAAIESEIARIRSLPGDALRRRWRTAFGRIPPTALSKDLLARMITRQIQEQAFGGLDRDSLRFLDGLARQSGPRKRQLKPGTVLVRDYQGQRHTVTVSREGFDWQGTIYPSLSAIARAITGTAWSGPRFFALQTAGDSATSKTEAAGADPRDGRQLRRPDTGRDGLQPTTGSPLPLETVPPALSLKP